MGKILRVDLTSGSLRDENLPEEPLLKKLVGEQALASYRDDTNGQDAPSRRRS